MEQTNFFKLQEAESINGVISRMPKAELQTIWVGEKLAPAEHHRAVVVNGKVIDIPSNKYVLVQHEQAFRPIIEGLTVSGIGNFQFTAWCNEKKASVNILVGEAGDGVKYGFKMTNSLNRSSNIEYGFDSRHEEQAAEIVEKNHVLVWGYRQVCSNGMVMKVPLKTCKYLDAVTVTRVKELLTERLSIRHYGKEVFRKLETAQYITEAFLLLKQPLTRMINDAQAHRITREEAKLLIKKYIGKRRLDQYMELYGREEQTLWGVYNSITFLASHKADGLSDNTREQILVKASDLLENELMVEVRT